MNGRDLNQFQFDYDQTWSMMFLRPDGTVLARYGSRNATDGMTLNSMAGLAATMKRVLQTAADWPQRKELYEHKRGPDSEYQTVEAIPSPTIQKIVLGGTVGEEGCIHCHNVYDAKRDVAIQNGKYDPWKRWKYPFPENMGLRVDETSGTQITDIVPGGPAEKAGVSTGEEILTLNGQAIHSLADIQFALHFLPAEAEAQLVTEHAGVRREYTLQLPAGWREGDIGWRVSMYGMPPRPGLWVQAASPKEKAGLNLPNDRLALKVRGVFGGDVRKSGLQKGDVIVGFGEETGHHTAGQFHAALRLGYFRPNSVLPLTVLRNGERTTIRVTFLNKT